ncbi:MAG TPA: tetratricopeptide repeat protein [Candidatus Edwardsbacteria bacterium]|nr:tetratricopeptide repeat protein [Candidatus Edwardsbacteria bacterium]
MTARWRHLLLIALAVAAAYWPALRAGFGYDDRFFVQENEGIRQWSSIPSYFVQPATSLASVRWQGIWRPLRSLSFLLDYKLWGPGPAGFHLTNIALHLANALLFYILLLLLFKDAAAALAAALLFALHPAQTEAVAWISSRGDLLFALFALGSLILSHLARGRRTALTLAGSLLCFALALLAKETAIVLPALVMLTDWLQAGPEFPRTLRQRRTAYILFWSLAVLYFIARRLVLGASGQCPYWGDSFATTALTMVRVAADYVRLAVWPWPLHVDYVYTLSTSPDWRVAGCALLLAALTALAVRDARRGRRFAWAWAWFMAALLPVSNLIPITTLLAERFLYLPLMGVAAWAALRWSAARPRIIWSLPLAAVLCGCAAVSMLRALEWRDPLAFWRAEVRREPRSFIAQGYLGGLHFEAGRYDSAELYYLRSAALEPRYVVAHAGLARLYAARGDCQAAAAHVAAWLAQDPDAADAHLLQGICAAGSGDRGRAEAAFRRAAALDPNSQRAWYDLGLVLQDQRRFAEAVAAYQRAAAAGDDTDITLKAKVNAAVAYETADPMMAAAAWREALRFARQHGLPLNSQYIERRIARLQGHREK